MQAQVVIEKIDAQGMRKARVWSTVFTVVFVVLLLADVVVISGWPVRVNSVDIPKDALIPVASVFVLLSTISLGFVAAFQPKYRKNYGVLELESGLRIRLDELTNPDLDGLVRKASSIKLERNQPSSV